MSPAQTEDGFLVCTIIRDTTDPKRTEEKFRTVLEIAKAAVP